MYSERCLPCSPSGAEAAGNSRGKFVSLRPHKQVWRSSLLAMSALLLSTGLASCAPTGPTNGPPDLATLRSTKSSFYGQQSLDEATAVGNGTRQPVLDFTVEGTPPSIFVNYVVPDTQASAFAAAAALPPGFSLAKMQILESDPEPRYWLSLNVYRVSGLTTGLRAEWSTYVNDGSATRFMILRARASEGSIDPIGPLALPEPFGHSVDSAGLITTAMNKTVPGPLGPVLTGQNLFTSTIQMPPSAQRNYVVPTRSWVGANDFIYWTNGVNDRTFHNSTSHSAPLISIDTADVTLADDTEWAPFVDPVPGHVLVYLDKLQFMISPWWNVTEPDGRVDPNTRATLFDLKKTMYSGLMTINALGVIGGTTEPIVQSAVVSSPQSVYWHWKVPASQLSAFETAAHLPAGLTLAEIRLQEGDPAPAQWLTLNVYKSSGATTEYRAEWTTYVNDGTSRGPRTFVLESSASAPVLDPIHLFAPASAVSHWLIGASYSTVVGTGPTAFSSSVPLPSQGPPTVLPHRDFVGAGDLRYWSNGVADRVFAESTVLDEKISVDPSLVSIANGGAWSAFVAASPDLVWIDRFGVDRVTNPWWNLNGL